MARKPALANPPRRAAGPKASKRQAPAVAARSGKGRRELAAPLRAPSVALPPRRPKPSAPPESAQPARTASSPVAQASDRVPTSAAADAGATDARAEPAIVRHLQVGEDGAGQRLDNFLVKLLKGVPKTHLYRIIRSGEVRVNGGRADAATRLALGDELRLPPVRTAEREAGETALAPPREFVVVYEDDHLLAIDKPAGVAVHGGSGVSFGVIEQLRRARPQASFLELVHRLDRETSGLLLVAKKRSALTALQQQFRARETGKTYAALVAGDWPDARKRLEAPLHKYLDAAGERRVRVVAPQDPQGLHAITLVRVAGRYAATAAGPVSFSLLDVTIQTGRTHQIRVHLAHEGHAIVGDDKYGDFALNKALARGDADGAPCLERMFLHARRLAFDHPSSAARIELEAPLPPECTAWLGVLHPRVSPTPRRATTPR